MVRRNCIGYLWGMNVGDDRLERLLEQFQEALDAGYAAERQQMAAERPPQRDDVKALIEVKLDRVLLSDDKLAPLLQRCRRAGREAARRAYYDGYAPRLSITPDVETRGHPYRLLVVTKG